jgi:hypothetical protein
MIEYVKGGEDSISVANTQEQREERYFRIDEN